MGLSHSAVDRRPPDGGDGTPSGSGSPPSPPENGNARVVVVGGGIGGISMASIADKAGFQVTLIERRVGAIHKPGGPKAIVTPDWAMTKGLVPLRSVVSGPHSRRIQETVKHVNLNERYVELATGEKVPYDYVVVAVGSQNLSAADPPPEFSTSVAAMREHYGCVSAAIRSASKVVIVGGGAVGCEFAGRVREVNPKAAITIVHSGNALCDASLPGAKAKVVAPFQKRLAKAMAKARIDVRLSRRVASMTSDDCPGGYAIGQRDVILASGTDVVPADLVLWCAGSRSNAPAVLDASYLNERGLVKVDKLLRIEGAPTNTAFAIGDCTDIAEPKLSVIAGSNEGKPAGYPFGHADTVLANLLQLAQGQMPTSAWGGLEGLLVIVPVTKKAGGSTLGGPQFLCSLKTGAFDYSVQTTWGAANMGKMVGKAPVHPRDQLRNTIKQSIAELPANKMLAVISAASALNAQQREANGAAGASGSAAGAGEEAGMSEADAAGSAAAAEAAKDDAAEGLGVTEDANRATERDGAEDTPAVAEANVAGTREAAPTVSVRSARVSEALTELTDA